MISRRNYIVIAILMFSVLFLCMSLNHLKDDLSDYAVNRYTETAENYPLKTNAYVPGGSESEDFANAAAQNEREVNVIPRNLVVCIGDDSEISMRAAAEWVTYTKRNIAQYPTVTDYRSAGETGEPPEMLVIEPSCMDWAADATLDFLDKCLSKGISLVFCGLPDVSVIQNSPRARELLGIQSVVAEETAVEGFYLREGFLLGGAILYLEKSSEGEFLPGSSAFPGERTFPWYLPASGTKVYMKGVPQESVMTSDDYPIVLWRNRRENAYVFAVNGDFMRGQAGIGLLSAMSAEMHDYELYPVINAQNIVLTGYPSLADENPEEMERLYSRSLKQVFQELLWPNIALLLQKYGYRATCMMTPQYDYSDDRLPDGKQLEYYLKIFAEQSVETGFYGLSVSNTPLLRKLEEDRRFLQEAMGGYDIASFYAGGLEDGQIEQALRTSVLSSVKTVLRDYDETRADPVEFWSEKVTVQTMLDGMNYTYESDFLIRGMETALGYLGVSFDLSQVAYPDDGETTWTQLADSMASTVSTYGQQYPHFSRTTAAECDARIRQFLALDYSQSRTGNQIRVRIEGDADSAWFILRTHNEAIQSMDGGSWEELEEGAYLIQMTQENVILTLGPADERHYR